MSAAAKHATPSPPEPRVLSIYVAPHPNEGWVNLHRPPKIPTEESDNLLEKTRALGRLLGQELRVTDSGEGTDGSITDASGLPKLDSLGIAGTEARSKHNQIRLSSLLERTQFSAVLIGRLGRK